MSAAETARVILVWLALAFLAVCVHAQPPEHDDNEEDGAGAPVAEEAMMEFRGLNFEQWVFRHEQWPVRHGGIRLAARPRNAGSEARERLVRSLALEIDEIDRVCELAEAQKKKLQLAGRGDITRFFDRYDALKRKVADLSNSGPVPLAEWRELCSDRNALQAGLAGIFADGSIFRKSLPNCLSAEQGARYEWLRDRQRFNADARRRVAQKSSLERNR